MGPYFLGCTVINQMIKCDQQGEILINLFEMNIFYA